jgi:hypothetical protein
LDISEKIPPNLKKLYKKLSKIHNKNDVANLQLDQKEFRFFANLLAEYTDTRVGKKCIEQLADAFGVQRGELYLREENFGGLKLLVVCIGQQEVFAINYTVTQHTYGCRKS